MIAIKDNTKDNDTPKIGDKCIFWNNSGKTDRYMTSAGLETIKLSNYDEVNK